MKVLKKTICILAACLTLIFFCSFKEDSNKLNISAKSAICMDCRTKLVLFEKNSEDPVPIASTTKIMTALVAIKYGNLDKTIKISKNAASVSGNTVGYRSGEEITLRELLHGLLMRSGNDAAVAISEGVGGSIPGFINLMNEYALGIGLTNTHYETPHGLDSQNHYSTAYDLAYLTSYALKNDIFKNIVQSKDIDAKAYGFTRSYHNINKILWKIKEATGVKTGYTGNAGKCLVTSINHDGHDIVIVVLNCFDRWNQTSKIYKYIKDNYSYKTVYKKTDSLGKVKIPRGRHFNLMPYEDIIVPMKKGCEYSFRVVCPKNPVNAQKNQAVGYLEILKDGKGILNSKLITN